MIKKLYSDLIFKINPPKVGVVATLTRSGTWYCRCFFFALHKLLKGDKDFDSTSVVREFYAADRKFAVKDTLGLDRLFIAHATCPGFKDHYRGDLLGAWGNLRFYGGGLAHDNGDIVMQNPRRKKVFDPYFNRNAKIIYIYRNPLDQAVSSFVGHQNHKREILRYKINESGERELITDVKDYFYSEGLDAFIKQFFTFKAMQALFPKNILILTYEQLIREPEKAFTAALRHFGCKVGGEAGRVKVRKAIELASQQNLREAEKNLGFSLANDRAIPGDTQMRGGAVGKWKEYFDKNDLARAEEKMATFNLTLKDCVLE